ncbi:MAG: cupin domain-containing protein [Bacteroidota bacterium]
MSDKIFNKATGDSIEFIQTDKETQGQMSHFIMTLAPGSNWAKWPRHFHPFQTETFRVISGELKLTVGKENYTLGPHDKKVIVNKFVLHSFWNEQEEPVVFEAEIYPPKNIEKGLRLSYKLSQEGKVNKKNIPFNLFYTLVLMSYFDSYFAFIPWRIQRFLFQQGAKFAKWFGYQ